MLWRTSTYSIRPIGPLEAGRASATARARAVSRTSTGGDEHQPVLAGRLNQHRIEQVGLDGVGQGQLAFGHLHEDRLEQALRRAADVRVDLGGVGEGLLMVEEAGARAHADHVVVEGAAHDGVPVLDARTRRAAPCRRAIDSEASRIWRAGCSHGQGSSPLRP
jgi:hypothetical protein